MTDFGDLVPAPHRPLRRHRAALQRRRGRCGCAARSRSSTASPAAAPTLWELLQQRGVRPRARRGHRQPGDADGPRRPEGDLPVRLAGRRRRQHRRRHVSRTSRSIRPMPARSSRRGSTAPCSAPTRSSIWKAAPKRDWFAPIVADAEAGFGGPLNCFEIMKAYIEAGAAGVHFEDQLASREEVRPSRRQGADPDPGARSATSTRRGSPPTSAACRPCWSPAPTPKARS